MENNTSLTREAIAEFQSLAIATASDEAMVTAYNAQRAQHELEDKRLQIEQMRQEILSHAADIGPFIDHLGCRPCPELDVKAVILEVLTFTKTQHEYPVYGTPYKMTDYSSSGRYTYMHRDIESWDGGSGVAEVAVLTETGEILVVTGQFKTTHSAMADFNASGNWQFETARVQRRAGFFRRIMVPHTEPFATAKLPDASIEKFDKTFSQLVTRASAMLQKKTVELKKIKTADHLNI